MSRKDFEEGEFVLPGKKKYLYFLIKSTGTEIYFYVITSNSIPIKH